MLLRQRVKTVTHVVELLNFVQDRIRMHGSRGLTEGGGERSGPPAVLFASTQQQPELPHLAKLIVRTVQF